MRVARLGCSMEMMRVGLQLPSFSWPGGPASIRARLADIARTAEAAGFASLGAMVSGIEHVIINLPDAHQPSRLASIGRDVLAALEAVRP